LCLPFLPFIDTVGDFKIELFLLLQKKLQTSQPENFKHWLGSVARRKMYDMMRKRRPKIMDELPERKLEIAEIWNLSLDFSLVIEAIENLKADQRLYIEMAFFLGYKQREICKELAWSTDKSRKVRQNAIRNLRKALGKNSSGLVDYLKTA
ncbi:MAG: sigma-70 family RNA polymerase sigma factor, partial [Bacteroidota bacterium]